MKVKICAVLAITAILGLSQAGFGDCEDLVTEQLTNNDTNETNIKISGQNAVWTGKDTDANGGDYEIYFYDGNSVSKLTDNDTDDIKPAISGKSVVWQGRDADDGDWEIFYYNGQCIRQLTNNDYDDISPRISGSLILWRGWDGNDWEVMRAVLPTVLRMKVSPSSINLKSKGNWITIRLYLGSTLQAEDVIVSSLLLEGEVTASKAIISKGSNSLMGKFSRADVQALLDTGKAVEITLTGQMQDGTLFTATDTVKVIKPGNSKKGDKP
jgi:hypothetical protein